MNRTARSPRNRNATITASRTGRRPTGPAVPIEPASSRHAHLGTGDHRPRLRPVPAMPEADFERTCQAPSAANPLESTARRGAPPPHLAQRARGRTRLRSRVRSGPVRPRAGRPFDAARPVACRLPRVSPTPASGAALRASPVRRTIRRPAVGPAAGVLIRSAPGRSRAGPSAPRGSGPPARRTWRRPRCVSAPRPPCGPTGVLRRAGCA
jgi:hypothetical protein